MFEFLAAIFLCQEERGKAEGIVVVEALRDKIEGK